MRDVWIKINKLWCMYVYIFTHTHTHTFSWQFKNFKEIKNPEQYF